MIALPHLQPTKNLLHRKIYLLIGIIIVFFILLNHYYSTNYFRFFFLFIAFFLLFIEQFWRTYNYATSPLFVFSCFIGFVFSIIPYAIWILFAAPEYISPVTGLPRYGAPIMLYVLEYFGSDAEFIVLFFATTLLATHCFFFAARPARQNGQNDSVPFKSLKVIAAVLFILSLITILLSYSALRSTFILGVLNIVVAPALIVLLLFVTLSYRKFLKFRFPILITIWVCGLVAVLIAHSPKVALLTLGAGILLHIACHPPKLRTLVIFGLISIGGFVAMSPLIELAQKNNLSLESAGPSSIDKFLHLIVLKAHLRQTETGYCLLNAYRQHAEHPFSASRYVDLHSILIPRVLWPDKPNFSSGNFYASQYCRIKPSIHQSASITILGQPLIRGGRLGLLTSAIVILSIFIGLTFLQNRSTSFGTIAVLALMPWWIDFEQDYAIYIGNIIKYGSVIGLVTMAAVSICKNQATAPSSIHVDSS